MRLPCSWVRTVSGSIMLQTIYSLAAVSSTNNTQQLSQSKPFTHQQHNVNRDTEFGHYNSSARISFQMNSVELGNGTNSVMNVTDIIINNHTVITNISCNIQVIGNASTRRVTIGGHTYLIIMLGGLVGLAILFLLFGLANKAEAYQSKSDDDGGLLFEGRSEGVSMFDGPTSLSVL